MRKLILRALAVLCLLSPAAAVSTAAEGQTVSAEQIEYGYRLEESHSWQQAIAYYEKLQREHTDDATVARRLQIVRIHHDVWRRYNDESFLTTVDGSSLDAAIKLYGEVLGKLQLYYVENVPLYDLARNGTAFVEVALTEPPFIEHAIGTTDSSRIEQYRLNVHRHLLQRPVSTVIDAQRLVAAIATDAQQQIGASPQAIVYEYIAGAAGMLDPYSAYLTAAEYTEIMSQIEGNLIGIGVELWAEGEELEIVQVFDDGPAAAVGLAAGDRVLAVDGAAVSAIGAKKAADMLRGNESTNVDLLVIRGDESPRTVRIVRRRLDVASVTDVDLVDEAAGIGYLRISNFQKTTCGEVDAAIVDLHNRGMRSLIIDLRRNPGGLLDAAVELADRFLPAGGIVSTRGRNGAENHNFTAHYAGTLDLPLMILIDEDSASASEIFAGAISDNRRGLIVGRTSYGKGSVQGVFHNDAGAGGLRLTVSKFYAPSGYAISNRGVHPDIELGADQGSRLVARPAIEPTDGPARSKQRAARRMMEDQELNQAVAAARDVLLRLSANSSIGR